MYEIALGGISLKSIVTSPKSNANRPYCEATHKMHVKYRNTIDDNK